MLRWRLSAGLGLGAEGLLWGCPPLMSPSFPLLAAQFSGPVPTALGNMPNLWRIRLAYNHFYGT